MIWRWSWWIGGEQHFCAQSSQAQTVSSAIGIANTSILGLNKSVGKAARHGPVIENIFAPLFNGQLQWNERFLQRWRNMSEKGKIAIPCFLLIGCLVEVVKFFFQAEKAVKEGAAPSPRLQDKQLRLRQIPFPLEEQFVVVLQLPSLVER